MQLLEKQYKKGELEKYSYIRKMHKINKSLSIISKRLQHTNIKKIEILENDLIFTTKKNNIKIHFNGIDRRGAPFEMINFGYYEKESEYFIDKMLSKSTTIFDIGANIGWCSIKFAKKNPSSNILSFEPIPYNFNFLKKNVKLNKLSNIFMFNKGLANENKKVDFFFFPEGSILSSQRNLLDCEKAKKIKCIVQKLDDFVLEEKIKRIDFIKCDVEGGEFLVFAGAHQSIKKFSPIIFVELCHEWLYKFGQHPNDIINKLSLLGYCCFYPKKTKLIRIRNLNKKTKNERLNYFFLHKTKHAFWIKKFN